MPPGRSPRDVHDLEELENAKALVDKLDWLLSILELRLRQAMDSDQEMAGGLCRLAVILGPGIIAIRGMRRDIQRLSLELLEVHNAIRDRRLTIVDD